MERGAKVEKTCRVCGAVFLVYRCHSKRGQGIYCSRSCLGIGYKTKYKGKSNPNWRRGYIDRPDKRRLIYSPDHPNKSKMGYVLEYRLVVEKALGRYLLKDEIVHHIDNDPSNNKVENLKIMRQSDHARLHKTGPRP